MYFNDVYEGAGGITCNALVTKSTVLCVNWMEIYVLLNVRYSLQKQFSIHIYKYFWCILAVYDHRLYTVFVVYKFSTKNNKYNESYILQIEKSDFL